jgi:hypothetical protein
VDSRLLRIGLCVTLLAVALPRPAHAIPVIDWKTMGAHFTNMVAQVSVWYGAMRNYRDTALDKARELDNKARQLVHRRERYEREAAGELGALGRRVPDWREHVNVCKHGSYKGYDVCTIDRRGQQYILSQVNYLFDRSNDLLFDGERASREQIRDVMGSATTLVLDRLALRADQPIAPLTPHLENQVDASFRMEGLAEEIVALVDETIAKEDLEKMVSSGRANQLAAHLAVLEADALLEIVRQRASYLRTSAVDVMDRTHEVRVHIGVNAAPLRF